jgi:hypothetical protein
LNDSQTWVQGMHTLTKEHMGGWSLTSPDSAALAVSRDEAITLGAKN